MRTDFQFPIMTDTIRSKQEQKYVTSSCLSRWRWALILRRVELGTSGHFQLVAEAQGCAPGLLMLKSGWAGPNAGPAASSLLLE